MHWTRKRRYGVLTGAGAGLLSLALLAPAGASSHREAPLITEDPVADNTDVYAFVSPDKPDTITVIANWIPFEDPAGGPNFHRFGDDVLYEINLDVNGDANPDIRYQFRFKTTVKNPDTFLYNTGPVASLADKNLNVVQTYTVTEDFGGYKQVIGNKLTVAPANVGPRSTPDYEANLGSKAVYDIAYGQRVFAGPRDDPFFADLGSIFDLAGLRPLNQAHLIKQPTANGIDNLAPYNTHSVALQIPIAKLRLAAGTPNDQPDPIVGVYSSTYRRQTRVFKDGNGAELRNGGPWVQVSRLGMPLVNEVVVPLGAKDLFNASNPLDDAQFGAGVLNPEVARLIPVLYPGVTVPPAPRNDIAAIFLTGIDGLNKPAGGRASEMIRLNTAIKPTIADPNKQNRMGLLGGDRDGFPNGRRLGDDSVDIALQALAGATPFTPAFNISPNNLLGDGVDRNNVPFLTRFPYVAPPKAGYESGK